MSYQHLKKIFDIKTLLNSPRDLLPNQLSDKTKLPLKLELNDIYSPSQNTQKYINIYTEKLKTISESTKGFPQFNNNEEQEVK